VAETLPASFAGALHDCKNDDNTVDDNPKAIPALPESLIKSLREVFLFFILKVFYA
jgi:hypothetical protein